MRTDTFFCFSCPFKPQSVTGFRTLDRRSKVKVDGSIGGLWQNHLYGLHGVTCYAAVLPDLKQLCRFKSIELVNET